MPPLLIAMGIIIGCACTALLYALSRRKLPSPRITIRTNKGFVTLEEHDQMRREQYLRGQQDSLEKHTDAFFGKPVGEGYNAPFPYKQEGYVLVEIADDFPNLNQRYIFEWMVERMSEITSMGTERLLKALGGSYSREEARSAFRSERISRVVLEGSEPVRWTILFDTDIGEGESFQAKISGYDQNINEACLYM